nr:hypothetical protein CTI12_AA182560 [Tanacetum cinerariifolium]
MINFIDITCEDHFNEVLKIQKSLHPFSSGTTSHSNSFPSITSSDTGDSSLKEFTENSLFLNHFHREIRMIILILKLILEKSNILLNQDPSIDSLPKTDIYIIDPILERFTYELDLVYSFTSVDDDDDLFYFKFDNEKWKKIFDSTLPEESSEIFTLLSSSFGNEDKVPSDESKVHIEVLSVLWENRLPILAGSLSLFRFRYEVSELMIGCQACQSEVTPKIAKPISSLINAPRKIEESLNVTFDETPPPSNTSPLVVDDLDEQEVIKVTEKRNLDNDIEDETLEIDEIVNIKESRNHPLENVIGNLNQRTLRSQA